MFVLSGLGLIHARRTAPEADLLPGRPTRGPDLATTPVRTTRNGSQPPADDLIGTPGTGSA